MPRLRRSILPIFVCLLSWVGSATATRTVNAEGVIPVKLEIGQPTAMVFPEVVSTVTTALPESRLQVKVQQGSPYVGFVLVDAALPASRQVVVGDSGRVYLVSVEAVGEGKRGDDLVYVTHKAPTPGEVMTPVSVIRMLRWPKGEPLVPQTLTLPLPTLPDTRLVLVNPRQYMVGPYHALVVTVENTQDTALHIDERVGQESPALPMTVQLQSWLWPPGRRLEGVAIEETTLAPHSSITLYAVFKER